MAQRFLNDPLAQGVGYPVIGKDSIVFYVADALYIDTDGLLTTATTSSKILGYSLDNVTMSSTNSTVAKVCPNYVYALNTLVVYPADEAVAQTGVGAHTVFASATAGAQTLDGTVSDTVGQFQIMGFDPAKDGTTTDIVVRASLIQGVTAAAS